MTIPILNVIFMVISLGLAGMIYKATGKANYVVWVNLAAAAVNALAVISRTTGVVS